MDPIVIQGKYTKAEIYAKTIEDGVYSQIYDIINCPAFKNKKVVLMPDVHVGASGPCGLCAEIGDWICPEHVGVDIGCTVSMMILNKKIPVEKYAEIEHKIKKEIPMGTNIRDISIFKANRMLSNYLQEKDFYKFLSTNFNIYRQYWPEMLNDLPTTVTEEWISSQLKRLGMDEGVFYKSLGTIGGGNHFIEYDESDDAEYSSAITLHFGSRNFGVKICKYWTAKAGKGVDKSKLKEITKNFKEEYKKTHSDMKDFQSTLSEVIEQEKAKLISGYLTGENMKGYLMDMCFGQLYALYNHRVVQNIISGILYKYDIKVKEIVHTSHNFIDLEDHILRKSAISAKFREPMIVPFNMRDGIAVCTGVGNENWLNSCAHGAGRKMSRSKAKETLSMEEFKNTMSNIYSTSVSENTIDESPMAYKDSEEIQEIIQDTCVIKCRLFPKISIKCDEAPLEPWKNK